jgi:hypothetical protein
MDTTDATSRPLRLVDDEPSAEAEQEWDGVGSLDQFLSAIGRHPPTGAARNVA